jgi:hypothetical protein
LELSNPAMIYSFMLLYLDQCAEAFIEVLGYQYIAARWEVGDEMGKLHHHSCIHMKGLEGEMDTFKLVAKWQLAIAAETVIRLWHQSSKPPAKQQSEEEGSEEELADFDEEKKHADFGEEKEQEQKQDPKYDLPSESFHEHFEKLKHAYAQNKVSLDTLKQYVQEGKVAESFIIKLADCIVSANAPLNELGEVAEVTIGWRKRPGSDGHFPHPSTTPDESIEHMNTTATNANMPSIDTVHLKGLCLHKCTRRCHQTDCKRMTKLNEHTRMRYFESGGRVFVDFIYSQNVPGMNRHAEFLLIGARMPIDCCIITKAGGVFTYVFKYNFKASKLRLLGYKEVENGRMLLDFIKDAREYERPADDMTDEAAWEKKRVWKVFLRYGHNLRGNFGVMRHLMQNLQILNTGNIEQTSTMKANIAYFQSSNKMSETQAAA